MNWAGLHLDEIAAEELLFSLPMPAFVKDTSSRFVVCNQPFADYARVDASEIVGKSDDDMPWADHSAVEYRDWDRRILETGESVLEIVETIKTASGVVRAIETDKFPLRDLDGQIVGLFGRIRDRGPGENSSLDRDDMVLRYIAGESVARIAETAAVSPSEVYAALRGEEYVATWQSTPKSWDRYPVFVAAVRACRLGLIRDELQLESYVGLSGEYAADFAFVQQQRDALNRAIAESDMASVRDILDQCMQNRLRELRTLLASVETEKLLTGSEWAVRYSPTVMQRRYAAEQARIEQDLILIDSELPRRGSSPS